MNPLYRNAIVKASQVRKQLGFNMFQPINIFDLCVSLGISLQFVDINMEGFYIKKNGEPTILISSKRPLPRRSFTCGHELGHHVFAHGLKVDILSEDNGDTNTKDDDEILVDAFAAALLMPVAGILAEFAKRNWNIQSANSIEFYTIASLFGVGYQTLIIHCKVNDLITEQHASSLLKLTPAKIFKNNFGKIEDKSYFKIIDKDVQLTVVDLEVSNYLIMPSTFSIEEGVLQKISESEIGIVYQAIKPGISTVQTNAENSFFLRIQRENYVGFAEYRHFED